MYIKGSQIPKEKQFIGKTTNVPQFSQMHHNHRIKKNRALFHDQLLACTFKIQQDLRVSKKKQS